LLSFGLILKWRRLLVGEVEVCGLYIFSGLGIQLFKVSPVIVAFVPAMKYLFPGVSLYVLSASAFCPRDFPAIAAVVGVCRARTAYIFPAIQELPAVGKVFLLFSRHGSLRNY
jgi:hypothetical protein